MNHSGMRIEARDTMSCRTK